MSTTEAPPAALDSLPTIHQLLGEVKRQVGPVGKDSHNTQQNFNYRGIDAVVNAAAPALDQHGVLTIPELLSEEHDTVEVGKNRSVMGYTRVRVCYHFYGPRGDEVKAVVPGEAMDSGDKAISKAMSVAYRIALIQVLNLPTGEPDVDSTSYERSARDESWRGQPPVNKQRGQEPAGSASALQSLEDGEWKSVILDVADSDQANVVFADIVKQHHGGMISAVRRRHLEGALREHMANVRARANGNGQASNGHQPAPAAEPQPAAAADPVATGQDDPWASEPNDIDPLEADYPAEPAQAAAGDQAAEWLTGVRKIIAEAQHMDALKGMEQQINAKMRDKTIPVQVGAELAKAVRTKRNQLDRQPAGASA